MKKWNWIIGLAALAGTFVETAQADTARAKHVFIVSIDQGNPDLLRDTKLPVLDEMVASGAHTWEAYTIVPSSTLPSHVSMLTGVGIQKHQVTWNGWQPDRGELRVPTVFSLAREQGLVTAMFVGKNKLKHLEVPDSLDHFAWPQPNDDARTVANAFADKVATLKPNLCFIHFRDPDTEGHAHGAFSAEKIAALRACDDAMETIRQAIEEAGLMEESVIIVTADHGAHDNVNAEGKTKGTHGGPQSADVLIPWIAWGKGVKQDSTISGPVVVYDTAATALWLLGVPQPEDWWGKPVKQAFNDMPKERRSSRPWWRRAD